MMSNPKEWDIEMRRVVLPHIEEMSRELRHRWPTLDPELLLLHWLCVKRNLEPPAMKLRKNGTDLPPAQDLPIVSAPQTARPYGSGSKVRRNQPLAPITASNRSSLEAPPSSADAAVEAVGDIPLDGPSSARLIDLGASAPISRLAVSGLPLREDLLSASAPISGSNRSLGLRSLRRLNMQIEGDAQRHEVRSGQMALKQAGINDMIATMRSDLRGSFLRKVPLLSRNVLTDEEQRRLVGKLKPWTFPSGHRIIVDGEPGDQLYILEGGHCEVTKVINGRSHTVGVLTKGAFFGEISVLYDIPRTATVRASTEVTVLSLSRSDLCATVNESQLERMRIIARTQVFSSIPLFSPLDTEVKIRIAHAFTKNTYRENAIITGETHATKRIYIIESGQVLMEAKSKDLLPSFWPVDRDPKIILGPGGFFGMRGLLYGAPFGFNITALTEVETLSISYEEILDTSPADERGALKIALDRAMRGFLLRQIPQLSHMAEEFFSFILDSAEEVHFKKWEVILSKDDDLEAVYVLEKGMVAEHYGERLGLAELPSEVERPPDEDAPPPRVMPGEFWGAECLRDKKAKASATLVALTDVSMLRLPPVAVWKVLQEERQHLAGIPLLSEEVLGKAEQYLLVGLLKPWSFEAGETIIKEGDVGDMLFVLEKGVCDAVKVQNGQEVVVSQLKKGAFFGELAVMFDMPRSATVRAATDVLALSLCREDIFKVLSPEKIQKMSQIASTQAMLQNSKMLLNLESEERLAAAQRVTPATYKRGDIIVLEGEVTGKFHLIEQGEVLLMKNGRELGKQYPGFLIGEGHCMYGQPSHCSCVAFSEQVSAISLSVNDILAVAKTGGRPALERRLTRNYRRMLVSKLPQMKKKPEEFIAAASSHFEVVRYSPGDLIIEKGRRLDALSIIESGQVYARDVEPDAEIQDPNSIWEAQRVYGIESLRQNERGLLADCLAGYNLVATTPVSVLQLKCSSAHLLLK
mmetsp:Transcript_54375/g.116117  ORF Transcript_54375/g.116117 Transcript_54375/m.116117 type:complete len:979 (-) Transcript_54375:122-3058(-)|eukprot:CAMPEP_0206419540 /NCGR_PEP_ID=MMETSP0324_2-20121206/203_1 /ASSEMBLY_ACC=CAM_ASM_000836 /TAXON_ID=2866 /ORGANISM="Crypthecodinium cohnii, Strain Seligo" /LENGTH=978 /DNA_ID=CAMNT_0053883043 /DNA_START=89 /DNA_END=3025 /DNA_ORIENTATION=-